MRSNRKAAVLVSAALCGSLALGATAVAATAATEQATAGQAASGQAAPAAADPEAEALLEQAAGLGAVGGLLKPVTDLVGHALAAPGGKASPDKLGELKTSVDEALTAVAKAGGTQAAAPRDRAAVPAPPPVPDLTSLKAHLATLLDAVTKADPAAVVGAAKAALGDLTELVLGAAGQTSARPSAQTPAAPAAPAQPGRH